jgi:hypothetical protein
MALMRGDFIEIVSLQHLATGFRRARRRDWLPLQNRIARLSTTASHCLVPYPHDALVTD